ncbi:MAG: MoaD/ThiS family protein [Ilumatobacteraceae bacterium]
MVSVHFTANLRRHVDCPEMQVEGRTVREVLDAYFLVHPAVRSYVLDEQGATRRHVAVFANGSQITDPAELSDPVDDGTEIYVMQALSGGT